MIYSLMSDTRMMLMGAVRSELYIALLNAGVPEDEAGKLAASDTPLDVEATLIAVLNTLGKVWKRHRQLENQARNYLEERGEL